jgi:hypothetical protein
LYNYDLHDGFCIVSYMTDFVLCLTWQVLYCVLHDRFCIVSYMTGFVLCLTWQVLYCVLHDRFCIVSYMTGFSNCDMTYTVSMWRKTQNKKKHDRFYIVSYMTGFILCFTDSSDEDLEDIAIGPPVSDSEVTFVLHCHTCTSIKVFFIISV